MRYAGQPFGVISVYSHEKQEWTYSHFQLADWLAAQCGHIMKALPFKINCDCSRRRCSRRPTPSSSRTATATSNG